MLGYSGHFDVILGGKFNFVNFEHLGIVYISKVCIAKLPAIATLAELASTFLGDMTQIGTLLLGVTPFPP